MHSKKTLLFFLVTLACWQCNQETSKQSTPVTKFGMIGDKEILQYTLRNHQGMVVKVINYGATITDIFVPDKTGVMGNVVLGFDSLKDYMQDSNPYIGPTIGRFANRIGKAQFKIGSDAYKLTPNNNGNTLHGGNIGFHKVIWNVEVLSDSSLQLTHTSPDGEDGFPGNLKTTIVMTVGPENSVKIDYTATTDKATPVSFTNHAYFNLSYGHSATILDHELMMPAQEITPVDSSQIPTGKLLPVMNTPFNFMSSKKIVQDLEQVPGGYDHNFVLLKEPGMLSLAAILYDPKSGRKLELFTTEPGVQFYSGNFLDGSLKGKSGIRYIKHAGLCLEPQHFPDSPNQPDFPNSIIQPGETYKQTSIFKFSVQ